MLGFAVLAGCGGHGGPAIGEPVQLRLQTVERRWLDLSELQGHPTLVLLFATYDSASQLAWAPLDMVGAEFPKLQLIGIALQPDAEALLPMYQATLGIEHLLLIDPQAAILSGETDLGPIEAIPQLVLLDGEGRIVARRMATLSMEELRSWLREHL